MRAVEPHIKGFAINPDDGVRIAYEVFGPEDAERTVIFLPTWVLVHSRNWKMQAPYFAQQGFRVVTYDGRGCGHSDRPASGYSVAAYTRDAVSVLHELGIERTAVVCISAGAYCGVQLAAEHAERVSHLVVINSSARTDAPAQRDLSAFLSEPPDREGWNKVNAIHWRENYRDFVEWFIAEVFNPPHSTKQIEDFVSWALETNPEILITDMLERAAPHVPALAATITCPTLIIQAVDDRVTPFQFGQDLHEAIEPSRMMIVEEGGHGLGARDPVRTNLTIHDFLGRDFPREQTWRRAMTRPRRALFVSSPIGLGHVQRDLAIARALRRLVPDLQIDWLAQHPVTTVLEANGERIHPLSRHLASESLHIESEMTGAHDLNVFRAWRNMDEILLTNFHVFLDVVRETPYDLWIGDEAWEVDYYLHENPELKTAPFVWLTDFVGWLPMPPDPDGREAFLTADYNAEMIEQVARFPYVRDVSLFIGNPDDIVPDRFGDGLPSIRDWTEANFDFTGYVRYFDPDALPCRSELRARFGFRDDERIAVAAAGGTSVGSGLLRRIIDAYPVARDLVPDLRLVVVCGPRIDPANLPQQPGLEYRRYVHNLYEMLAASDVALVQGGLSTTMELVAARRPFLYFPLTGHFEQNRHVTHRLERYGVPEWARMSYAEATPETIANRLVRLMNERIEYRAVETGGALRAAEKIARLL